MYFYFKAWSGSPLGMKHNYICKNHLSMPTSQHEYLIYARVLGSSMRWVCIDLIDGICMDGGLGSSMFVCIDGFVLKLYMGYV